MTNCCSEFIYKDATLHQSFSYLREGSKPTGAICGLEDGPRVKPGVTMSYLWERPLAAISQVISPLGYFE